MTKEQHVKHRISDWLTQRSTWMAFGAAAIVVVARLAPDYVDVCAGVLSAFGLFVRDRQLSRNERLATARRRRASR